MAETLTAVELEISRLFHPGRADEYNYTNGGTFQTPAEPGDPPRKTLQN